LASLRYDAQWVGVRASDAGAPHGRFRVFVYAWPADTASDPRWIGDRDDIPAGWIRSDWTPADADLPGWEGREPAGRRHLPTWGAPTDTARHGRHEGRTEPTRLQRGPHAALSGDATPTYANGPRAGRDGRAVPGTVAPVRRQGGDLPAADDGHRTAVQWGDYEPAIRRWERLTRPAPSPTEPSRNGAARLSPRFVEFLMGLPAGHVTGVPGLSRNDQLKALGNGVVPQQAAYATRIWLAARLAGSSSVQSCA
jgi:DNA (cytosine-5)-methyltransferase 1